MRFWDSSAIIPLILDEPGSDAVTRLLAADPAIAVWWGTWIECCSAIARRHREGLLDEAEVSKSLALLELLRSGWIVVEAGQAVAHTAVRLVRTHPLRAADALQLAAAITFSNADQPNGSEFVCSDTRLAKAAKAEGFLVLPAVMP